MGTHAVTILGEEMPDGARDSDEEVDSRLAEGDPHAALANIDLDEPLRPGESLPVRTHHRAAAAASSKNGPKATLNGVSSPEPDVDVVRGDSETLLSIALREKGVAEVKAEQRKQRKK